MNDYYDPYSGIYNIPKGEVSLDDIMNWLSIHRNYVLGYMSEEDGYAYDGYALFIPSDWY